MTKTDIQLQHDIVQELHGAVALLGTVDHYAEKWAAETAAKRVSGVRTVAPDLEVKLLGNHQRNDADQVQVQLIL